MQEEVTNTEAFAPIRESSYPAPQIPEEFWIQRGDDRFVKFAGLLDAAHKHGLRSIETEELQQPTAENGDRAKFKATASFGFLSEPDRPLHGRYTDGDHPEVVEMKFTGHGDADPDNVSRPMRANIYMMAETRAIVRALRFALNIGAASIEEIAPEDAEPRQDQRQEPRQRSSGRRDDGGGQDRTEDSRSSGDKPRFKDRKPQQNRGSEPQVKYLKGLMSGAGIDRSRVEAIYGPVEDIAWSEIKPMIDALKAFNNGEQAENPALLDWLLSFQHNEE